MKPSRPLDPSIMRVKPSRGEEAILPGSRTGEPGTPGDEYDLLSRCRNGDKVAFGVLVDRYRNRACRLARRLVRSDPDAEEVAQDAFVRAWLGIRDFREDALFSTWLSRIVVRKALDRIAMLRGRRAREVTLEEIEEPSVPAEAGKSGVAGVAPLVDALPESQRAAILLYYFKDRSVSEVATILSIPEGTVKTHLSRARATLRKELLRQARQEASNEV